VKLTKEFYQQQDVVMLARELLGKVIFTFIDGQYTAGIISETEAYAGVTDKASHAFGGRRTNRTEVMFAAGGVAYVYLCYGIHHLFNVVTGPEGTPHAILVRGIFPTEGIEIMMQRRKVKLGKKFSSGPGTSSAALGLKSSMSGTDLLGNIIWIEDMGFNIPENEIYVGPRIGVDYAGDDAALPYRFLINDIFPGLPESPEQQPIKQIEIT